MLACANLGGRQPAVSLQDFHLNARLAHGLLDAFRDADKWLRVAHVERHLEAVLETCICKQLLGFIYIIGEWLVTDSAEQAEKKEGLMCAADTVDEFRFDRISIHHVL